MARNSLQREFVPNQVFVGLPWKHVRPRYEKIIHRLEIKFPLHFSIVGRNDGQSAEDLFEIIKSRISRSSVAIFDSTGGNANVSLEYGYAEGIGIERVIYLHTHKAAAGTAGDPIISDLGGKRRVQYKTEKGLAERLNAFCREHPYTKRYEQFLQKTLRKLKRGEKKSKRTLAIKVIHALDGYENIRRDDLIQRVQSQKYNRNEIEDMIRDLHNDGLLNSEVGRYSRIQIT